MWFPENDTREHLAEEADLLAYVRCFDIDCAHAHDVVGAVFSYCRARHGTIRLDRDYLQALTARSLRPMMGRDVIPETEAPSSAAAQDEQTPFQRVLHHAHDPSVIYEARRRGLLRETRSWLVNGSWMLRLDIGKIKAHPREDLLLNWALVYRRLAGWVGEWRSANPGLDTIKIDLSAVAGPDRKEHIDLLVRAFRNNEFRQGLAASRFLLNF